MEEVVKDLCETRSQLNRTHVQLTEMAEAQRHTNGILAGISETLEDLLAAVQEQATLTRSGIEEATGFQEEMRQTRRALEARNNDPGPPTS
jgi:hypothetical protein